MTLKAVPGGWVRAKPELFVQPGEFDYIQTALNNAFRDWKYSPVVGKKYVWFDHHAEEVLGIKCEVDYHSRIATVGEILDQEKFILFMLRYS